MANMLEHVAYLSQEIGPRPAGTEEEQQSALYITEQLQKDAGLSTVIEDFTGVSNPEITYALLSGVSALLAIVCLLVSALAVPAIVVSIIAAALTVLERFGHPVLSNVLSRGVSQNVLAQYKPAYSENGPGLRRRKIVIVAHYDSGKVRAEMKGNLAKLLPVLNWASLVSLIAIPVFLIIRFVGFIHATGTFAIALNVIMVVIAVIALIPTILAVVHKLAAYNEAANCNASGVAVMLDVASRIGKGRMSEAELSQAPEGHVVHGEEAARSIGVVPEGAELVYETHVDSDSINSDEPASAAARLAAAKAAVAAISGKPVSATPAQDVSENLVQVKEQPVGTPTESEMRELRQETREALSGAAIFAQAASETSLEAQIASPASADHPAPAQAPANPYAATTMRQRQKNAQPAWYIEAQKKAKRPATSPVNVHRSRYASALDAAEAEGTGWFSRLEKNADESPLTSQVRQLQDGIMEVKAPTFDRNDASETPEADAAQEVAPTAVTEKKSSEPIQQAVEDVPHGNDIVSSNSGEEIAPRNENSITESAPITYVPSRSDVSSVSMPQMRDFEPAFVQDLGEELGSTKMMPVTIPSDASEARAAAAMTRARTAEVHPSVAETDRDEQLSVVEQGAEVVDVEIEESARQAPRRRESSSSSGMSQVPIESIPLFDRVDEIRLNAEPVQDEVKLPDLGDNAPKAAAVSEDGKQRAPLAEAATLGKNAAKSLLSMLPSLSGSLTKVNAESQEEGEAHSHRKHRRSNEPAGGIPHAHDRAGMRTTLPSLSGSISSQSVVASDKESEAQPNSAPVGSAGMTGAFAPVGEELMKESDGENMFVEDADDSVYEGNYTESGAFAGPGYVDMPSSRLGGFFNRFKHHKGKRSEQQESSPQEWLNVSDDFNAREVGKARGGWESFREDESGEENRTRSARSQMDSTDSDLGATTTWTSTERDETGSDTWDKWGNESTDKEGSWDEWNASDVEDDGGFKPLKKSHKHRRWHGGAFSRLRNLYGNEATSRDESSGSAGADSGDERRRNTPHRSVHEEKQLDRELEQIYRFRNPDIATEVWFVALGSEIACHSGMKAFVAEHEADLRGAIIIELEGLGAGKLSFVEREGGFVSKSVSSRMGRYITKATKSSGVSAVKVSLPWSESTSAYAMSQGLQALHLVGMDGAKPALAAEADDVLDNVNEEKLNEASDFLIALLKSI